MDKTDNKQTGFITMMVLLILILLAAVSFGAYRVMTENNARSRANDARVTENNTKLNIE